jgi:hypothetical protein
MIVWIHDGIHIDKNMKTRERWNYYRKGINNLISLSHNKQINLQIKFNHQNTLKIDFI